MPAMTAADSTPQGRALRSAKLTDAHRAKLAVVYVRQSTPQQVAENVNESGSDIDVFSIAGKCPRDGDVHQQPDASNSNYRKTLHRHWRVDPLERLHGDPKNHPDHEQRIDECSDNLDSRQPERVPF